MLIFVGLQHCDDGQFFGVAGPRMWNQIRRTGFNCTKIVQIGVGYF